MYPHPDDPPVEKLPARSQSFPGPTYVNPNEDQEADLDEVPSPDRAAEENPDDDEECDENK